MSAHGRWYLLLKIFLSSDDGHRIGAIDDLCVFPKENLKNSAEKEAPGPFGLKVSQLQVHGITWRLLPSPPGCHGHPEAKLWLPLGILHSLFRQLIYWQYFLVCVCWKTSWGKGDVKSLFNTRIDPNMNQLSQKYVLLVIGGSGNNL